MPTDTLPSSQAADLRPGRSTTPPGAPLRRNQALAQGRSFSATAVRLKDAQGQIQEWTSWRLRFAGQGGEYFKLWIVNVLLTIATLGLFHPWARIRKLRYLTNATMLDGQALQFHGKPWPLLRGYLLLGVLAVLVHVAVQFSQAAAFAAILAMALLTPALWRTALRYRLANTSWRGIRFQFTGSWGGAYLPFLTVVSPLLAFGAALATASARAPAPLPLEALLRQSGLGDFLAVCLGLTVLLLPAGLFLLRRYQHNHYRYGEWQTRYQGQLADFYRPFVVLLLAAVGVLVLFVLQGILVNSGLGFAGTIAGLLGVVAMVALYVSLMPYLKVSMFRSTWGRTVTARQQVQCDLKTSDVLWLTFKNNFLISMTLGLYWPVAQIRMLEATLQSLRILSPEPLALGTAVPQSQTPDSAGEAALDLFGIDFGL